MAVRTPHMHVYVMQDRTTWHVLLSGAKHFTLKQYGDGVIRLQSGFIMSRGGHFPHLTSPNQHYGD